MKSFENGNIDSHIEYGPVTTEEIAALREALVAVGVKLNSGN